MKYGFAIPETAAKAQDAVMSAVETMTGFSVRTVNVHVGAASASTNKKEKRTKRLWFAILQRRFAVHLAYELSCTDKTAEELVAERLSRDGFAELAGEDELYSEAPNAKQAEYIRALVCGVADHAPELDEFIARYAKGWSFDRIPLVASAIMRVAMYEILYFRDVPNSVAINEAVEIAKKYETPETVKFINGILGSFVRAEISAESSEEAEHRARRRSALYIRHLQRKNASQENAWNSK